MTSRTAKFRVGGSYRRYLITVESGATYVTVKCSVDNLRKLRKDIDAKLKDAPEPKLRVRKPRRVVYKVGDYVTYVGTDPNVTFFKTGDRLLIVGIGYVDERLYQCILASDEEKWKTDTDGVNGEELVYSEIEKIPKRKVK